MRPGRTARSIDGPSAPPSAGPAGEHGRTALKNRMARRAPMDTAQPNLFGEVDDRPTIFTVGHSTRPFEELIDLLRAHRVKTLADVRAFPRSRRHPHFNLEHLADRLPEFGLGYVHLPGLGGRRRP